MAKQKANTALHIIGLTLGLSVCLLTGLYLRYELTFDAQYQNRIYRINSIWTEGNNKSMQYATPIPLAEAMRTELAGEIKVAIARPEFESIVALNSQKLFKQNRVMIVEPEFIDIFNVEVIRGRSFNGPYQAMLTESTARKFYGDEDPIGKTFRYRNEFNITVSGIIQDFAPNTSLPASMVLSFASNAKFLNNGDEWRFGSTVWASSISACTFVALAEKDDPAVMEARLNELADKYINIGKKNNINGCEFKLQPLRDIHFDPNGFGGGPWVNATDTSWLWFIGTIGILVLLLACINFLNLSTAQTIRRTREVGVRKCVGAGRSQLIFQFLSEAWILAGISAILSIVIAKTAVQPMNQLLEKGISFHLLQSLWLILFLVVGVSLTGLLAGLYPAWIISRVNATAALKGHSTMTGQSGLWVRKTLVTTQFAISASLLITVLLITRQVEFMRSQNPGFEKDNIVLIEIDSSNNTKSFAQAVRQLPQVKGISFSKEPPINDDHWWNSITKDKSELLESTAVIFSDDEFYSLYGLRLLSGRIPKSVERVQGAESPSNRKVVVNERLLKVLGLGAPEIAVGKTFQWGGETEIAGVVADFNFMPFQTGIYPLIMAQNPDLYKVAGIKIQSGSDIPKTIESLEHIWKKTCPNGVFEFRFLDDHIDRYYKGEVRLYTLFKFFAGMAILISCLGLWGLVTFGVQQRTKEIGIRKTLGASVHAILVLISRDFLWMIIGALVIASLVTKYLMEGWLQNFAYHIQIGWQTFLLAGISLVSIVIVTISFQTLKAALANPVKSLRSE